MYLKIISILLPCLLLFPLIALASDQDQVPEGVRQTIEQDLNRFKQSLVSNGTFDLSADNADKVTLGRGIKRYIIKGDTLQPGTIENSEEILDFIGYVFPIHAGKQSNGIVLTDPKGERIIAGYDDFKLSSDLEKAEELVGIDENSKLIYDDRLSTVGLVSHIDGKEVFVPLSDSTVLSDLKPFALYNINELKEMLDTYQEARAANKTEEDPSDLPSGGSSEVSSLLSEQPIKYSITKIILLSVGAGVVISGGWLFTRKKKMNVK